MLFVTGLAEVSVKLENGTVWLSLDDMSLLFDRDRRVIGKHVGNIFEEEELVKEAVWANFAHTAKVKGDLFYIEKDGSYTHDSYK